jgi:type IV pilus biogenesis protein CpaD/CtpE
LAVGKSARRALAAALAGLLCGCASTIADNAPAIGLPDGVPERPATRLDYPAVHDMPPRRADTPLSKEEQQKLEKDLIEAREGQGKRAEAIAEPEPAPKRVAAQKKKTVPARTQAAGSNRNP